MTAVRVLTRSKAQYEPRSASEVSMPASGFKLERTEMTGTNFYFSRLLEAVRVEA